MEKKILVVVDMQKDFIDGALGTKEAVAIVPKVKEKIKTARKEGEFIIFTKDTHKENYLDTQEGRKLPTPHCIKGTEGWKFDKRIAPMKKDAMVFEKEGFGSTELAKFLASLNNIKQEEYAGREEGYKLNITLVGLCTDICVISNAILLKTVIPEAEINVCEDCCAGVTPESHLNAIQAMRMCQINII